MTDPTRQLTQLHSDWKLSIEASHESSVVSVITGPDGHTQAQVTTSPPTTQLLWVPDRSSMLGDLGKFVGQSAEPVATSEAKAG
jgi:hypothetical protein